MVVMGIKKIIFKVGGNIVADLNALKNGSKKQSRAGTITIHVRKAEDIPKMLSPRKINELIETMEEYALCPDVLQSKSSSLHISRSKAKNIPHSFTQVAVELA